MQHDDTDLARIVRAVFDAIPPEERYGSAAREDVRDGWDCMPWARDPDGPAADRVPPR